MSFSADLETLRPRFERLLLILDTARRDITRRESYHLQDFVEFVGLGQWQDAAEALRRAEHSAPIPMQTAHLVETNNIKSTVELRRLLLEAVDRFQLTAG